MAGLVFSVRRRLGQRWEHRASSSTQQRARTELSCPIWSNAIANLLKKAKNVRDRSDRELIMYECRKRGQKSKPSHWCQQHVAALILSVPSAITPLSSERLPKRVSPQLSPHHRYTLSTCGTRAHTDMRDTLWESHPNHPTFISRNLPAHVTRPPGSLPITPLRLGNIRRWRASHPAWSIPPSCCAEHPCILTLC